MYETETTLSHRIDSFLHTSGAPEGLFGTIPNGFGFYYDPCYSPRRSQSGEKK